MTPIQVHSAQIPQISVQRIEDVESLHGTISIVAAPPGIRIKSPAIYWIAPILGFLILCSPVIIGYALHWGFNLGRYILSIYAFITLFHMLIQFVLCTINRVRMDRIPKYVEAEGIATRVGLLVAGYREDPTYWRRCLESIKLQNLDIDVIAVVDGDDHSDEYMAREFASVFENAVLVKPGFVLADMPLGIHDQVKSELRKRMGNYTCIIQPHQGKRSAMYTGLALFDEHSYVAVTDSDTILAPNAVEELLRVVTSHDTIGAVTGDVQIDNDNTFLSFLSSVRYWFAFNMDRGSGSALGTVNCISGPLGIYRMDAIRDELKTWKFQTFLGMNCTYGDDRHLTNVVLNQGYRTHFTHNAQCKTESPSEFNRWISQQTRWMKSFHREILFYTPQLFTVRVVWIYASLVYNAFFPLMNIYGIITVLFVSPSLNTSSKLIPSVLLWIITILIVSFTKAVFGAIMGRKWRLLLVPLYSFLYVLVLLPLKVTSVLFIRDQSWLTSPRLMRKIHVRLEAVITIVLWNLFLLAGISYSIVSAVRHLQ